MSWGSLILAALQLILTGVTWLKERNLLAAGEDQQIARASFAILQKTDAAKQILQQVNSLGDDQVDQALKGLEP